MALVCKQNITSIEVMESALVLLLSFSRYLYGLYDNCMALCYSNRGSQGE